MGMLQTILMKQLISFPKVMYHFRNDQYKDPNSYLSKFDNIDELTVITIPNEENAIHSNELYSDLVNMQS